MPQEETSEGKRSPKIRVPEGLALALIPAVAYMLTYSNIRAYFLYFGIPESAVVVDFASLLETSTVLIAILLLLFFFFYFIHPLWLVSLVGLLIVSTYAYIAFASHSLFVRIFGLLTVPVGLWFWFAMTRWSFGLQKNPDLEPPLKPQPNVYDPSRTGTLAILGRVFEIRGKVVFAAGFFFFIFMIADSLSESMGKQWASNEEWFLSNGGIPSRIILGRSGDRWVCAVLDSANTSLISSYAFQPISSDTTTWKWRRLAGLHPAHVLTKPVSSVLP